MTVSSPGPGYLVLYLNRFLDLMQGKLSKQDKIVNAMPFVAFLAIMALAVVYIFTQ